MFVSSIAQLAVTFFLVMDAIGNIPLFLSMLHRFPENKRRKIILREMIIALLVILAFAFLGNKFLVLLHVKEATVGVAGGIILFIISLQMIFPKRKERDSTHGKEEPFVVPLAVPLIAGPAILGIVMIYASKAQDFFNMSIALVLAWVASLIVLLSSTMLQRLVGNKVLEAGERLMGFIMSLISLNLITNGVLQFLS